MNQPIAIIFSIVVNFALLICFLRFMFQLAEIDPKHPYAKATYTISAVVSVFRRILPDLDRGRISLSAIMLMLLLTFIKIAGMATMTGKHITPFILFVAGSLSGILDFLNAIQYIILASVVVSWVVMLMQVMHPVMDLIMQLAEPIIAPFRRISPNLGMLDLSTLVAILALALLETVVKVVGANVLQMIS